MIALLLGRFNEERRVAPIRATATLLRERVRDEYK